MDEEIVEREQKIETAIIGGWNLRIRKSTLEGLFGVYGSKNKVSPEETDKFEYIGNASNERQENRVTVAHYNHSFHGNRLQARGLPKQ